MSEPRFRKRAWGWYLVLLEGENYKLKLLRFKRGGKLSVQKHRFRSELWLFIKGDGAWNGVTLPGMIWRLAERDEWHFYRATKPTWVIEVQFGRECKESDIQRAD